MVPLAASGVGMRARRNRIPVRACPRAGFRVVLGLGAAALPLAASAQDAESGTDLPTVVVTATRSAQAASDVPASIDAVAIDAYPDTAGVNPSEYLAGVPGLLARDRQNYAQDEQISIRGFGARSTFGVRGVRLYTDGIPATMPDGQGQVSHFNLDSAERIEVLRGPFSALYGNSSGGVIQIFTADGSDPPEVDLRLSDGSYDPLRVSANARGRAGGFGYNLDVTRLQTDGYREHSAATRSSGNAKLTWNTAVGARLTLLANTLSLPGAQDPLGLTHAQFDADPRQAAAVATQYDTRKSVQQNQGGAIWDQDLGAGQSLRVLGYFGQRDVVQYLSVPVSAQASPASSGGVVDLASRYGGADARWTCSGSLVGRPFEFTAGLAWDRQAQHRRGYENFVGALLGVRGALRRDEDDAVRDFDQYAQATWAVGERWSLSAGLRHSTVAFTAADHFITAANPDDSGRVGYAATTPVAGLLWRATDRVNLYASFGRGFETPTFSELGYRSDGGAGLAFDLLPARSGNREIGAKLSPGEHLEATFALFRADTRDELAVATSSGGRTTYQNIGSARRDGAEAMLAMRFAQIWKFELAWTWLDARFRSGFLTCTAAPCTTPDTPVAAGSRIPGVPRTVVHAALQRGGDSGWRASVQADFVGAVAVDDRDSDRAPAYLSVAFDVGYGVALGSDRLRAFARIDNLFDRRYAGSVIVNDANGRYFEPAPGRTATIGVTWRWLR